MPTTPTLPEKPIEPSWLEKFGLFYLSKFSFGNNVTATTDLQDTIVASKIRYIQWLSLLVTALVSILCVGPTVYLDIYLTNTNWFWHYALLAVATIISIAIEFYLLFLIALKAVHSVANVLAINELQMATVPNPVFNVKNILARTALEIQDPELKILGIDPFKQISKNNLMVLGILYKIKIVFSNLVIKYGLKITFGDSVMGISILYEAVLVEMFWNAVVIRKVILEARLRLVGFVLAQKIITQIESDLYLDKLSEAAKIGCLQAIGNAVVMTQNYHPNMMILLLKFQEKLNITTTYKYDDWTLFLETLKNVKETEKYFLLDLFTVSAAFDGKLSKLEQANLQAAYTDSFDQYFPRITALTAALKSGAVNKAFQLCKLDFIKG